MNDSAIKLFGMTIPFHGNHGEDNSNNSAGVSVTSSGGCDGEDVNCSDYDPPLIVVSSEKEDEKKKASLVQEKAPKDPLAERPFETTHQDDVPQPNMANLTHKESCLGTNENSKTPSIEEETATTKTSNNEKAHDSQEKLLKKPDKIIPCPRCNSLDTKFCYYNNYNVHQPRHFCKSCQRYWTAGGTMRNVPVGAGRRKNKHAAASHYFSIQAARIDAPNGVHHPALKCNGTVLNFGSDASLSKSAASALNLTEKTLWNGSHHGIHKIEEQKIQVPSSVGENGANHSSGSTVTAINSMEEGDINCAEEPFMPNFNGFTPQIQCLPGVPWPYPWNSAVPPLAFFHPGTPSSFYPADYWNCTIPGTLNIPWVSPNQKAQSPGPNFQTLGKHSRDVDELTMEDSEKEEPPRQKNSERSIWVPKTLRIDDPEEAAKSSIWTTLGIKNESISKGGIFKAFQSKMDQKNHVAEISPVLRINPAALSRSVNFHESS